MDRKKDSGQDNMRTLHQQARALGISSSELSLRLGEGGLTDEERNRFNGLLEGLAFKGPRFSAWAKEDYLEQLCGMSNREAFRSIYEIYDRHFGPVSGINCIVDELGKHEIFSRFKRSWADTSDFCQDLVKYASTGIAEGGILIFDGSDPDDSKSPFVGVGLLYAPLYWEEEVVGSITFYKRGEQVFSPSEIEFGEFISYPLGGLIVENRRGDFRGGSVFDESLESFDEIGGDSEEDEGGSDGLDMFDGE